MDLKALGIEPRNYGSSTGRCWLAGKGGKLLTAFSPVDGKPMAQVLQTTATDYEKIVAQAGKAFQSWRLLPAPKRGALVRRICEKIRHHQVALGALISYEMGKSLQEGLGEVQEMIDMGELAVGQARMLHGKIIATERPQHRLFEQYHPLGIVGVITAFNFPLAVWAWNALLAAVCGDVVIWKPSSKAPLTAIAAQRLIGQVLREEKLPEGIFSLVIGRGTGVGETMLHDRRLPLISFTGSIASGRQVAATVAARLGRSILELGGNNAIILTPNTDLAVAIPAVVFGAVGTAGQRCTTTRRLIIHQTLYARVKKALLRTYERLRIGDPLQEQNHMGPLRDRQTVENYLAALEEARRQGGKIISGGQRLSGKGYESGCYVTPALVEATAGMAIVREETFAPILYLLRYRGEVAKAIALQNEVRQGLSSAIFTSDLRESELFLSAAGSDCGIANVNLGTSGAEIGGAFGGEKESGGGREAGSDCWKAYMRRQTVTINYGRSLPLAQGIEFKL